MKIYTEKSLWDFEFWSGAKDRAEYFTEKDLDIIESELELEYPDGMDETEVNDLFWFEEDYLAKILGYGSFEDLMNDREGKE